MALLGSFKDLEADKPQFNFWLGNCVLCDLGQAPKLLDLQFPISKMRTITAAPPLDAMPCCCVCWYFPLTWVYVGLRVPHWSCFSVPLQVGQAGLEPQGSQLPSSPVKLCHGQAALHLPEVLHVGLWAGPAVHQHNRGRSTCEYHHSQDPWPLTTLPHLGTLFFPAAAYVGPALFGIGFPQLWVHTWPLPSFP